MIEGVAPDGTIEAVSVAASQAGPAPGYAVGVQWHPEFLISEGDARLFRAFLGAAGAR